MTTQRGRLLLVHAHPDDETINTGATMAAYAAAGHEVTLVTCTLGQLGEVIPADLAHLAAGDGSALGEHRAGELAEAMAALGVTDHRLLAGGRWRDSGMVWVADGIAGVPDDVHPDAFAVAPLEQVARALAEVVLEVRPHAVVTYDPGGGYRHPDHVRAHDATVSAVDLAAPDGWDVPRTFWVVSPRSRARADRDAALAAARTGSLPAGMVAPPAGAPDPPLVVDDGEVTTVVDGSAYLPAKSRALGAHRTQVTVSGGWFALSNDVAHVLRGDEAFHLARGGRAPGIEQDLLAGLDLSR